MAEDKKYFDVVSELRRVKPYADIDGLKFFNSVQEGLEKTRGLRLEGKSFYVMEDGKRAEYIFEGGIDDSNLVRKVDEVPAATSENLGVVKADGVSIKNEGGVLSLNMDFAEGISPISIKPTTPLTELNALPNGIYRAYGEGEYKFEPKLQIIEGQGLNVIPPGYSVKFLKDANGWSVSVVEKLPMQDLSKMISRNDLGYVDTEANTNIIEEITNSDRTDTELWEQGFLNTSGVISSPTSSSWTYTKKYYPIKGGEIYSIKLGVYGSAALLIYDDSKNVIANYTKGSTSETTYFISDIEMPSDASYIRFSFYTNSYFKLLDTFIKNKNKITIATTKDYLAIKDFSKKVNESLKLNYFLDGTNFLENIINTDFSDTNIWHSGFLSEKNIVSSGSTWHYSSYVFLLKGTYQYKFLLGVTNARCLIYNKDYSVHSVLSGSNIGTFTIDDDKYIRVSHSSSYGNVKTIYVKNIGEVGDKVVARSDMNQIQKDSAYLGQRKIFLDTYKPKIKRPLVTLISDDGTKENNEWYIPLLNEFGVKSTFAIVGGWVKKVDEGTSTSKIGSKKLRELYMDGHDIAAHTWTHTANWNTVLTLEQIEEEMSRTKVFLETITHEPVNMFISPFGIRNVEIDKIISRYYSANFISGYSTRNTLPLDSYFINRVSFDASEDTPILLWETKLKPAIDECILNKEWLVFAVHPQYSQYNTWEQKEDRKAELRTLLQYCKDNEIEVVTAKKGYEYYRNHVEIGVKRVDAKYYKLGMDMSEENINYF